MTHFEIGLFRVVSNGGHYAVEELIWEGSDGENSYRSHGENFQSIDAAKRKAEKLHKDTNRS